MTIVASPSLGFVTQKVMPLSLSYPQLSKISRYKAPNGDLGQNVFWTMSSQSYIGPTLFDSRNGLIKTQPIYDPEAQILDDEYAYAVRCVID